MRSGPAPVAIIGAGLAGCWLAHELTRRGRAVVLIDRHGNAGRGASGNPVGVVKPFVTRQASVAERFHACAFDHLLQRLARDELAARAGFRAIGVLQLIERAYAGRDDLVSLDRAASEVRAGLALDSAALAFERGGWLDPSALCRALIDRPAGHATPGDLAVRFGTEARPRPLEGGRWRVEFDDGQALDTDCVVLANGVSIQDTPWTSHLPITPARGQLDRFERGAIARAGTVVTGASWLIPDGEAIWAGATYDRDSCDTRISESDSHDNRRALARLAGAVPGARLGGRAGVRATLPDRLPLVGPLVSPDVIRERYADLSRGKPAERYEPAPAVPGLAVLGGLGSRGIVTSALSASLLADWLCADASALQAWYPLLAPHRFLIRDAKRNRL